MAEFKPFNYADAVGAGTRNALLQLKTQQAARQMSKANKIEQLQQRASKTGEDLTKLLEQAGMSEEANSLREKAMERGIKGSMYIAKRAPMVRDQKSLEEFNNNLYRLNLAQPGEMPDQWGPDAQNFLNTLSGRANSTLEKFGGFQKIPGMPGAYGQQSEKTGKWANIKTAKDLKGSGGGGLKAADENAIYRETGTLFGGTYNPITGTFDALGRDKAAQAQSIAEHAAQLFLDGKAKTRSGAVSMAARKAGINIKDLSKPEPKPGVDYVVATDIKPGEQTATNKKTGERAVLRNGKWLPIRAQ